MSDLISRADAIEAVMAEGRKVYTSEYANAERVIYEADAVEALSMLQSADADDRLYIKVYADDEPSAKAEKMYQICGDIAELAEVAKCIQGYCDIPSAETAQGWIPCSERLPSNDGCVLVSIDDAIEFGKYEGGVWSIWDCEHWDKWGSKGINAWMPLPDPYKGGNSV